MFDRAKVAIMAEITFSNGNEQTALSLRDLEVAGKSLMWVVQSIGAYTQETSMFDDKDEAVDYYNHKHNHLAQVYKR
jgi:hypothetical protein